MISHIRLSMLFYARLVIILSNYIIGIDTSNYKTSISVVDDRGEVVFARSEFLEVKKGERGLRQQTAFFMHNNKLPDFIDEAFRKIDGLGVKVRAIAVSDAPRSMEGSYMPVFYAGVNAARILATSLDIPIFRFSHQEGHIESVIHEDVCPGFSACIMHLSGGTTEVLKFSLDKNQDEVFHYKVEIIGGTKDISIGQLLDRIGVNLGFSFPAGKFMDEISVRNRACLNNLDLKAEGPSEIRIMDGFFNISGVETEMMRSGNIDKVTVLMYRISTLIYKEADFVYNKYGIKRIYICGGVSQSDFIRNEIRRIMYDRRPNFDIIFGDKTLSGDNAIGTAWLAGRNL